MASHLSNHLRTKSQKIIPKIMILNFFLPSFCADFFDLQNLNVLCDAFENTFDENELFQNIEFLFDEEEYNEILGQSQNIFGASNPQENDTNYVSIDKKSLTHTKKTVLGRSFDQNEHLHHLEESELEFLHCTDNIYSKFQSVGKRKTEERNSKNEEKQTAAKMSIKSSNPVTFKKKSKFQELLRLDENLYGKLVPEEDLSTFFQRFRTKETSLSTGSVCYVLVCNLRPSYSLIPIQQISKSIDEQSGAKNKKKVLKFCEQLFNVLSEMHHSIQERKESSQKWHIRIQLQSFLKNFRQFSDEYYVFKDKKPEIIFYQRDTRVFNIRLFLNTFLPSKHFSNLLRENVSISVFLNLLCVSFHFENDLGNQKEKSEQESDNSFANKLSDSECAHELSKSRLNEGENHSMVQHSSLKVGKQKKKVDFQDQGSFYRKLRGRSAEKRIRLD